MTTPVNRTTGTPKPRFLFWVSVRVAKTILIMQDGVYLPLFAVATTELKRFQGLSSSTVGED